MKITPEERQILIWFGTFAGEALGLPKATSDGTMVYLAGRFITEFDKEPARNRGMISRELETDRATGVARG